MIYPYLYMLFSYIKPSKVVSAIPGNLHSWRYGAHVYTSHRLCSSWRRRDGTEWSTPRYRIPWWPWMSWGWRAWGPSSDTSHRWLLPQSCHLKHETDILSGAIIMWSIFSTMTWKRFLHYWPFERGIHWSSMVSITKGSNAELWCLLCC